MKHTKHNHKLTLGILHFCVYKKVEYIRNEMLSLGKWFIRHLSLPPPHRTTQDEELYKLGA